MGKPCESLDAHEVVRVRGIGAGGSPAKGARLNRAHVHKKRVGGGIVHPTHTTGPQIYLMRPTTKGQDTRTGQTHPAKGLRIREGALGESIAMQPTREWGVQGTKNTTIYLPIAPALHEWGQGTSEHFGEGQEIEGGWIHRLHATWAGPSDLQIFKYL